MTNVPAESQSIIDAAKAKNLTLVPAGTGGGCTALVMNLPDGGEVLVTGGDATMPEADDDGHRLVIAYPQPDSGQDDVVLLDKIATDTEVIDALVTAYTVAPSE